jgi:hypothetical protein
MDIDWKEHCDKFTDHSYLSVYRFFIKDKTPKNILEIGVRLGAPFYYWRDIIINNYPLPNIVGIDNRSLEQASKQDGLPALPVPEHWGTFIHADFRSIDNDTLPDFDVIVDDASHWAKDQIDSLNKFYTKVTKDGLMIIEDVKSLENANEIVNNFEGDKDKLMIIDRRFILDRSDDILIIFYNI